MMRIGLEQKRYFFDRQAVIDAVGQANARNLSRAGSFVRRSARSSLRRRKRVSVAGSAAERPLARSRGHAEEHLVRVRSPPGFGGCGAAAARMDRRLQGSNRETVPELHELGGSGHAREPQDKRRRRARYARSTLHGAGDGARARQVRGSVGQQREANQGGIQ